MHPDSIVVYINSSVVRWIVTFSRITTSLPIFTPLFIFSSKFLSWGRPPITAKLPIKQWSPTVDRLIRFYYSMGCYFYIIPDLNIIINYNIWSDKDIFSYFTVLLIIAELWITDIIMCHTTILANFFHINSNNFFTVDESILPTNPLFLIISICFPLVIFTAYSI